jgi:hypothetical protein
MYSSCRKPSMELIQSVRMVDVPGISQVPSGQFQLLTYNSSFRESRKFRPDNFMSLRMLSDKQMIVQKVRIRMKISKSI